MMKWIKKAQELPSSDHSFKQDGFNVTRKIIEISNFSKKDKGIYRCNVTTKRRHWSLTEKINITMNGKLFTSFKVARYSFLKSGKHMFQTQNLVHWYFVRRMKLNVWFRTAFRESETVTKKCVTVVAMETMTFQNGC